MATYTRRKKIIQPDLEYFWSDFFHIEGLSFSLHFNTGEVTLPGPHFSGKGIFYPKPGNRTWLDHFLERCPSRSLIQNLFQKSRTLTLEASLWELVILRVFGNKSGYKSGRSMQCWLYEQYNPPEDEVNVFIVLNGLFESCVNLHLRTTNNFFLHNIWQNPAFQGVTSICIKKLADEALSKKLFHPKSNSIEFCDRWFFCFTVMGVSH